MTTGANSADSARSTKSSGTASAAVMRSRSASVRRTRSTLTRPKNAVADSPSLLLASVHLDQPIDDVRNAARRESWRPGGRTMAPPCSRAAADHDEVLRHGAPADPANAALESDRRDVMLAAAVRASADLDARPIGRRDQIGTRAQVVFEQTAQAARLRHREPARLGARAAGDVGNRCRRPRAPGPRRRGARTAARTSPDFTQRNTRF